MSKEVNTQVLKSFSNDECKYCHSSGMIHWNDEEGRPMAKECPYCNSGHAKKIAVVKQFSHIPSAYYYDDLTKFKWDIYKDKQGKVEDIMDQKKLVESFVWNFNEWDKEGRGLYICSRMRGSGKTFLASCICNTLISKYAIKTKFVSASDLIDIDKGTIENESVDTLCKCKLLVLDDFGQKQCGIDWMNDILFKILDSRMNDKLTTLITSNIPMGELQRDLQFDSRLKQRINKLTIEIPLPEYSVRVLEAKTNHISFLKRMGLIPG